MAFFKKNRFLITLLVLACFFRIPSLFEPYWYGDENIYLALGIGIRKGLLLYRDIFDNKPPLIYLLSAAAAGQIFWLKMFLLVSSAFSVYFFHQLGKNVLKIKNFKAATLIFTLLTTFRFLEGNIANAENFILLPSIAGIYYLFPLINKKQVFASNFFLFGLVAGLGLLLKVTAIFDIAALIAFWFLFSEKEKLSVKKEQFLTLAGYLTPVILTGIFFLVRGSFAIFFKSCFLQTMGYLSSWKTGSHSFSLVSLSQSKMLVKTLILVAGLAIFYIKRKFIDKETLFVYTWLLFSLFGATLSGRPYSHYLIEVVPAFSFVLTDLFIRKNRLVSILGIALTIFTFWHYSFWTYPSFSYYQNFVKFSFGRIGKNEYFSYFDKKIPYLYHVSETILAYTQPNEKIFVWADEPSIYPLTKKTPATPFTVAYHIKDLNYYDSAENFLLRNPPAIIVYQENYADFSLLKSLIKREFYLIDDSGFLKIFRRK